MTTASNICQWDMTPPDMLEEVGLKAEQAMLGGANGHDLGEMTKEEKTRRKQKFRFPRMVSESLAIPSQAYIVLIYLPPPLSKTTGRWRPPVNFCSCCLDMGRVCNRRPKSGHGHACKRCRVARTKCSLVLQSMHRTRKCSSKEMKDRKPLWRSGHLRQGV